VEVVLKEMEEMHAAKRELAELQYNWSYHYRQEYQVGLLLMWRPWLQIVGLRQQSAMLFRSWVIWQEFVDQKANQRPTKLRNCAI